MTECTNFPLDDEDCKKCKEYPCSLVMNRNFKKILKPTKKAKKEMKRYGITYGDEIC